MLLAHAYLDVFRDALLGAENLVSILISVPCSLQSFAFGPSP